jgi:rhodanese-related sulfurtransferase
VDFPYRVSEIPNSRDDTHTPANGIMKEKKCSIVCAYGRRKRPAVLACRLAQIVFLVIFMREEGRNRFLVKPPFRFLDKS